LIFNKTRTHQDMRQRTWTFSLLRSAPGSYPNSLK